MSIIDLVKYNGGPDVFAWKYPSEELSTGTQLIVNETQEAVLFKGGKAMDVFMGGTYTLETENIPILSHFLNLPFGGRSPFTAEVWFVNKIISLDIKWGTPTPIQIQDPKYGIFVPVRSNGMFGVQIEDTVSFLTKLVGTLPVFDRTNLVRYFRGLFVNRVKDTISSYLVKKQVSILEINAYLEEISDFMKERIEPVLAEYGIRLASFYVNDISVPEEDPAVRKLKDALAKKAEMNIIGYSYQQERSFNTLEGAAKNPGTSAAIMGTGMGLGMGVDMGSAMGGTLRAAAGELNIGTEWKECPSCHNQMEKKQRFCGSCGYDTEKAAKESSDGKVACNKCGYRYEKNVKFCPECGNVYNPCPNCGADLEEGTQSCPFCGYELPVKCKKCGSLVARTAKFCPECGESLVVKCPKCGTGITGTPKYCPECGENLREGLM